MPPRPAAALLSFVLAGALQGAVRIGDPATDIPGVDARGVPCSLSDDAGRVILLDISTAWCHWCREDAPMMESLQRAYGPRGLKVVTVLTQDVNGQGPVAPGVLSGWAAAYGLTFRVQSDAGGVAGVAERVYVQDPASGGYPTFVIIDRGFRVRYLTGGLDLGAIKAKVEELLAP
ncbi:MAG TPA: TlpA disulfide reductase family protein [Holophaga sp.]|nr:TlpA disulfide reductase family protein [Holophaga sp.]